MSRGKMSDKEWFEEEIEITENEIDEIEDSIVVNDDWVRHYQSEVDDLKDQLSEKKKDLEELQLELQNEIIKQRIIIKINGV